MPWCRPNSGLSTAAAAGRDAILLMYKEKLSDEGSKKFAACEVLLRAAIL